MVFALAMNYSAVASASPPSRRRDCSVDTLMLRRAATERGESWCLSASKVARTTLYGLDEPSDFATTSCKPRVSNTARIGPPAMLPVPGGGARGEQFADFLRRRDVRSGLATLAHRLFQRRRGDERFALQVVDQLRVDVLRRAEHREARAPVLDAGERDLAPHRSRPSRGPVQKVRHGAKHSTSTYLPCGRCIRRRTSRPCPTSAPDHGSCGSRRPPGRPAACRRR